MPFTGALRVWNYHKILKNFQRASPPYPPPGALPPNPQRGVHPLTTAVARSAALRAASLAKQIALSVASLQIALPQQKKSCLRPCLQEPFIDHLSILGHSFFMTCFIKTDFYSLGQDALLFYDLFHYVRLRGRYSHTEPLLHR